MSEGSSNAWLSEREVDSNAALRLICLPHAGSGAAGFYRWRRLLPASIAVCPVELPGRERRMREPAAVCASELAGRIVKAIGPLLARPYALFGHSMGSLLAYEVARQVAEAGLPGPTWLFASGRAAPHVMVARRPLHGLGDDDLVTALTDRFGDAEDGLLADPELRRIFLPILRADLELVETYEAKPAARLACSIAAFAGVDDRSVAAAGLERWQELGAGRFLLQRFPGDHFYHLGAGQSALLTKIVALITS